jgi:D-3-phosphoglycerate dehydrogenase
MKVIYLADKVSDVTLDTDEHLFQENGIEYIKSYTVDDDEIVEMSKDSDVIITILKAFPEELINRLSSNIKGIVRPAIGFDIIDVEAATKRGIYVSNIPDYSTEEVAVQAMSLMLDVVRKNTLYNNAIKRGEWVKQTLILGPTPRRLSTLTLGILGFGNIAKNVAKYAQGFGINVVAYDPFITEEVFADRGVKKVTLDELYSVADIITIHIPLLEDTYHMINKDSITKMKDGVIIINTARGPLVCEEDLIDALESGKVSAAGLDVFEVEPLNNANNKLLKMENVVVTPHIGYYSKEAFAELEYKSVLTAINLCNGEVTYNVINKNALKKMK